MVSGAQRKDLVDNDSWGGQRNRTAFNLVPLLVDRDDRSVSDHRVDFFDLVICHGDTAPCPIRSQATCERALAVNEDVASWVFAERARLCSVFCSRVINSQRQVKPAVRVSAIDQIVPFGRLSVALDLFVADGRKPKVDVIRS